MKNLCTFENWGRLAPFVLQPAFTRGAALGSQRLFQGVSDLDAMLRLAHSVLDIQHCVRQHHPDRVQLCR